MKIGIDARNILNPERSDAIGVGHYAYQLIRHLLKLDQKNQYTIFFDYQAREKDIQKFTQPNVKITYFPWSDYKKYLPGAYSEILGLATISRNNFDVFHILSPDARVPLGYSGKVVCTFQDLAVFKYPDFFPQVNRLKSKYNRRAMAGRADKLIAVSENTKNDLRTLFKIDEAKIEVIKNGVDERFFEDIHLSADELKQELRDKFRLEKDYLLFIGTLEPIKNISRLLEAFKGFMESRKQKGLKHDYELAIAGKRGWLAEEYIQLAKDLNITDNVKFLGYVEGDDLKKLLKGTKLFVMPSLYEGFGMSVLEAMAAGTACLISDIPSLQEIALDAAAFVSPLDVTAMTDQMNDLVENNEKKQQLIEKGKLQAKNFSWQDCARQTLAAYESIRVK